MSRFLSLFLFLIFSTHLFSEIEWTEPTNISSVGDLFIQKLVFNQSGTGMAIWVEVTEDKSNLYYSHFQNSAWGEPKTLSNCRSLSNYSICMNSEGHALIAWSETDISMLHNYVMSSYFDGSNWSSPYQLAIDSFTALSNPKVALNDSGEGLVAWGTEEGHLSACFCSKDTYSKIDFLTTDLYFKEPSFDVAIHSDGSAIASWIDYYGSVQVKKSEDKSWSIITDNISKSDAVHTGGVRANFSKKEQPMVMWVSTDSKDNYLECCQFDNVLNVWPSYQTIGQFNNVGDFCPFTFDMNTKGSALAVWGGSNSQLKSSYFDGNNWSSPLVLSTNFSFQMGGAEVAINNLNEGLAIWNEGQYAIKLNVYEGSSWQKEAKSLTTEAKKQSQGCIAFNNSEQALVAWIEGEDFQKNNQVQAITGHKKEEEHPSHLLDLKAVCLKDYKNLTNSYVDLSWSASKSIDVNEYAIFKNDRLLTKLSFSQLKLRDPFSMTDTSYRVEALDKNNQVIAVGTTQIILKCESE